MSSPFPPEILCEIALHLPHTEDVISLSLTSHTVRAALSTLALFKARLLLQQWDIDAWQDEDDKAQFSGDWKRWIRIDYIHSKTLQLLEEAATGGLSPPPEESESNVRNVRSTGIHFGKTEDWSRRLSRVFPILISHHRINNIPRVAETRYCDALRAYLVVVTEIYISCLMPSQRKIRDRSSFSTFSWLERACFGLAAFVMQCNPNTIESIFGDAWTAEGVPDFLVGLFSKLHSTGSARAYEDVASTSMRYSAGFLIQVKIRLRLHFDAARKPHSLFPPSPPPMDLTSPYDVLGSATLLWPWLRDGLAGTPLAGLSSTSGCRWAGYYTITGRVQAMPDPPMLFELYLAPPPSADATVNKVYFRGEGTDGVGSFTLDGESDTESGVVIARKTYVGEHWWEWHGVITPFGMVGVWGIMTGAQIHGWWWIWPQEWSETSPAAAERLDTTLMLSPSRGVQ